MSGESGASTDQGERDAHLRARLEAGLRQISFFVIPDVRHLPRPGPGGGRRALRDRALQPRRQLLRLAHPRRRRASGSSPARWAGSTPPPSTRSRTPAPRCGSRSSACCTGIALGLPARGLPAARLGIEAEWGAPGLALGGQLAGWLEFLLLRRSLSRGRRAHRERSRRSWPGSGARPRWPRWRMGRPAARAPAAAILVFVVVIGCYAAIYVGITHVLGIREARAFVARLRRQA